MPTIMISTFRDQFAPAFNTELHAVMAAAADYSDWLVQRLVPGTAGGYGHCTFSAQDLLTPLFGPGAVGPVGVNPTP